MQGNNYPQFVKHLSRLIPDPLYIRLRYFMKFQRFCNLRKPQTFSEKLQWLKLYDRQSIYTLMVDKHQVKAWISDQIGESYVVPNLGVWDSFDDIDLDTLPDQFVLKSTHDSGGLAICKDRVSFDVPAARAKIEKSLARNYYYSGREWPYRDVKPRILAEVYLPAWEPERATVKAPEGDRLTDQTEVGMTDYKFYCFHGEPAFLYVSQGLHDHDTAQMTFVTCDWQPTGFARPDYLNFDKLPPKPSTLDEMLAVARRLSAGIPFVRVDLFEHFGRVLFSEMTFHPVSGNMPIEPKSADLEIGRLLDLSLVNPTR